MPSSQTPRTIDSISLIDVYSRYPSIHVRHVYRIIISVRLRPVPVRPVLPSLSGPLNLDSVSDSHRTSAAEHATPTATAATRPRCAPPATRTAWAVAKPTPATRGAARAALASPVQEHLEHPTQTPPAEAGKASAGACGGADS